MQYTIQSTIDNLKELVERGESNLDIAIRVYGLLLKNDHVELATTFNSAWNEYSNDESDGFPIELMNQIIEVLQKLPEPPEEKSDIDKISDAISKNHDGIQI